MEIQGKCLEYYTNSKKQMLVIINMVVLPLDYCFGKSSTKSLRRRKLWKIIWKNDGDGKWMKANNKRKIIGVNKI